MSKIGFIFPGQGSQTVGMGKSIYDNSTIAKAIYDRASTIIDLDVKHVSFEASEEELMKTEHTQPALFTIGLALHEMMRCELEKRDITVQYYAGHSLGEVVALAASGKFSFDDGLAIAYKRGNIMSNAGKGGVYAMAAIVGLDYATVKDACSRAGCNQGDVVVANYNNPQQVVISGLEEAVVATGEYLKNNGAKMVVPLKVSGAFHSPFMKETSEQFAKILDSYSIHSNDNKVISNVLGNFYPTDNDIKMLLVEQIYSEVNWVGCVRTLEDAGVDTLLELGPGKVLAGLIKKISPNIKVYNVFDMESFNNTLESL